MHIGDLTVAALNEQLANGLCFPCGPFFVRIISDLGVFASPFGRCYAQLPVMPDSQLAHFNVTVRRRPGLRGRARPQAEFLFEGITLFEPYPLSHAFPLFEWGLNWCIANTAHQYLMLHAAVVERNGQAMLLPAPPGSGKSTLCAGLVGRGWRLLSDEFGLVSPVDGQLHPLPRAAPLKNHSIEVIRSFAPSLGLGPLYEKTRKGDVVHAFPPGESLERQADTCRAGAIVFPRYSAGAETRLVAQPATTGLKRLISNSFNYLVTGEAGFVAMCDLVRTAGCYELTYSCLEEAVEQLADLLDGRGVSDEGQQSEMAENQAESELDAIPYQGAPA